MTSLPDRSVWLIAGLCSISIHAGLVVALLSIAPPGRSKVTDTIVALQTVATQQSRIARGSAALAPVGPSSAVAGHTAKSKPLAQASSNSQHMVPVGSSSQALAPAEVSASAVQVATKSKAAEAAAERNSAKARDPAFVVAEPAASPEVPILNPNRDRRPSASSAANTALVSPAETQSRVLAPAQDGTAVTAPAPPQRSTAPVPQLEQTPLESLPGAAARAVLAPAHTATSAVPPPAAAPVAKRSAQARQGALAQEVKPDGQSAAMARPTSPPVAALKPTAPASYALRPDGQQTGRAAVRVPTDVPSVVEDIRPEKRALAAKAVAALAPPPSQIARSREVDPYARVREYISGYRGSGCFLALPSPGPEGGVKIDGFAVAAAERTRFFKELVDLTGVEVETSGHAILPDQCSALNFARAHSTYPEPALAIRLDARSIRSGTILSGAIGNISRKMLYLIVIDDEGKVQEIEDLSQAEAGEIRFDAPMTLTGERVETEHLLMAIASDEALKTFASHEGKHAQAYFAALASEIAELDAGVDFGLASFFVD